jgi:hypothetical protein
MVSQQKITNLAYFPMLVSESGDDKKMSADVAAVIWGKFYSLSSEKQDILTAQDLPFLLKKLQDSLHLDNQAIGNISLTIRKIFFGELSPEQAEAKIGSMLVTGGGDPNQAKVIVDFIKSDILTIKPRPKAPEPSDDMPAVPVTESLPLLQAITKYEKLSQQIITNERIRVKSQQEPVRPSLVNWIKCYRDELGVGFHDSVQRGTFLFRSENCKRLTPPERERVNLILKSIEESYPLPIDTGRSEIVFPEYAALHPQAAATPAPHIPSISPTRALAEEGLQPLSRRMAVPENAPARIPSAASAPANEGPLRGAYLGGGMGIFKNGPQEIAPQSQEASGAGEVSFSSNHVFPAEKASIAAPATPQPVVPRPAPKTPTPQPNPFHIHPVSRSEEDN